MSFKPMVLGLWAAIFSLPAAAGGPAEAEANPASPPPARVLTVNGSATELLLRLGLEKHLVGTAYLDNPVAPDLAAAYAQIPVLAEKYPAREAALALEPDFIYGWQSAFTPQTLGAPDSWRRLGVRVFISRNSFLKPQRISNFYADLLEIGRIFNVEERARAFIRGVENDLAVIAGRLAESERRRPRVLAGEYLPNGLMLAYGQTSLLGEMLALAGGDNVFPEGAVLSAEGLAEADPEVLILVHMLKDAPGVEAHLNEIRLHPALSRLRAVKSGRIHPLPLAEAHCAGVRIPSGVRRLAGYFHPELFP